MRLIANFRKGEELRYISHLDVQRLLQRAMRRAQLPIKYSEGFNPHPLLAFSSALALGYTSEAEWLDLRLTAEIVPEHFTACMNEALPSGLKILRAAEVDQGLPTLTALMEGAGYQVEFVLADDVSHAQLQAGIDALLGGPIVVSKHTKGGIKQVDIRPQLIDLRITEYEKNRALLFVDGILNASGGLQVELLMQSLMRACQMAGNWRVHRAYVKFNQIEV